MDATVAAMSQERKGRNALTVAMFSVPAKGHFLPLCQLASELVRRGHTVIFFVYDVFEGDYRHLVEETGSICRLLPTGSTDKSEFDIPPKDISKFHRAWRMCTEALCAEWRASRPSVAIGDIFSHFLFEAAHRLGVPMVMNCAMPLSAVFDFALVSDPGTALTLAGFTVLRVRWTLLGLLSCFLSPLKDFSAGIKVASSSGLVLVNSFLGLEPQGMLPTNWVLTGPLAAPDADSLSSMARDHPKLTAWMDAAADQGQPVVYVSTGTMKKLTEWETQTLFAGLNQAPCKVVWSLGKDSHDFLPQCDKDRFWVAKWLPQSALLVHRATKLCISHCGWGGSMEAVNAGVPVFAIPFGAEQPLNARLLVDAGAASMLPKKPSTAVMAHDYKPGDFTAESVAAGLERMLGEPSFKAAMTKLRVQAAFPGGRAKACDQIEWLVQSSSLSPANPWKNPLVQRCRGHWSDYIIWPALCAAGAAGVLYLARSRLR